MQSFLKGRNGLSSKSFFIVLLTEVPRAWDRSALFGMHVIKQTPSQERSCDGDDGYSRITDWGCGSNSEWLGHDVKSRRWIVPHAEHSTGWEDIESLGQPRTSQWSIAEICRPIASGRS